jgi:hypothetical protein
MGTGDPDGVRIEVDDPLEFGLPLGRDGWRPPWRGAGWKGCDPPLEKALAYALDGIAAAQNDGGNLGDRAPLMGQKHDVGAESERGFGRRLVQLSEFDDLGVGYRR